MQMRAPSTWPSERNRPSRTKQTLKVLSPRQRIACRNSTVCSLRPGNIFHFITHSPDVWSYLVYTENRTISPQICSWAGFHKDECTEWHACLKNYSLASSMFSNYQFPIQLKCVKMFLTWSLYVEIVFRSWAFTSLNLVCVFIFFSISNLCWWAIC